MATLVGRAVGGVRWPWNRDKTLAGSLAFVAGAAAAVILLLWCRPESLPREPALFLASIAFAAALAAAAVETIPVRLDDNLSVALTAGATLWLASLIDGAQLVRGVGLLVRSSCRMRCLANASWLAWATGRAPSRCRGPSPVRSSAR